MDYLMEIAGTEQLHKVDTFCKKKKNNKYSKLHLKTRTLELVFFLSPSYIVS